MLQTFHIIQHDLGSTGHCGNNVALEETRLQLSIRVRLLGDETVLAGLGIGDVLDLGQVVDGLSVGQVRLEDCAQGDGVLGSVR